MHLLEKSRALSDQYFKRYEFFNLFLFFHIFRIFLRAISFIDLNFGPYVTTKMSSAESRLREMEGGRERDRGRRGGRDGGREREKEGELERDRGREGGRGRARGKERE